MQSTKTKKTNSNTDRNRKNKNKNKFLLCFRPVVMDGLERQGLEEGGGRYGGGDPVLKCVKLEHKDGEVFPQIFPTRQARNQLLTRKREVTRRIFLAY